MFKTSSLNIMTVVYSIYNLMCCVKFKILIFEENYSELMNNQVGIIMPFSMFFSVIAIV